MQGGLIVAESDADVALLEKRQALQEKWGLGSLLLSSSEVRRLAPYLADSVIAAGYFPHEGHANPRLVAPAFARPGGGVGATIRVANARDCPHARWRGVARQRWSDRAGRAQDVSAGAVLNAAGAWAGEIGALAHLHLPIFAVPLSMNVIERAAPLIPHLVQHASQRLTLKQVAAGNILVGGGWPESVLSRGLSHDHSAACRACRGECE